MICIHPYVPGLQVILGSLSEYRAEVPRSHRRYVICRNDHHLVWICRPWSNVMNTYIYVYIYVCVCVLMFPPSGQGNLKELLSDMIIYQLFDCVFGMQKIMLLNTCTWKPMILFAFLPSWTALHSPVLTQKAPLAPLAPPFFFQDAMDGARFAVVWP